MFMLICCARGEGAGDRARWEFEANPKVITEFYFEYFLSLNEGNLMRLAWIWSASLDGGSSGVEVFVNSVLTTSKSTQLLIKLHSFCERSISRPQASTIDLATDLASELKSKKYENQFTSSVHHSSNESSTHPHPNHVCPQKSTEY